MNLFAFVFYYIFIIFSFGIIKIFSTKFFCFSLKFFLKSSPSTSVLLGVSLAVTFFLIFFGLIGFLLSLSSPLFEMESLFLRTFFFLGEGIFY